MFKQLIIMHNRVTKIIDPVDLDKRFFILIILFDMFALTHFVFGYFFGS